VSRHHFNPFGCLAMWYPAQMLPEDRVGYEYQWPFFDVEAVWQVAFDDFCTLV
jgi:hypothetical protein